MGFGPALHETEFNVYSEGAMKIKSFEFNLREFSGSMGDFGTLFPLAVGYIAVCGLDPAGLLVMMGLANIVTGLIYRLPMPIEPMKVIAVVAIAQHWQPTMVYACGFAMGVIWLLFGWSGIMQWLSRITPNAVVRGIQVTLGILLAVEALKMIATGWLLGLIAVAIIIFFRNNKYAPAAIVLMALGLLILFFDNKVNLAGSVGLHLPATTGFRPAELWPSLLRAGFAQIPLTATNAVIATAALIKIYWPDRAVTEKQLSINMGVMNLIAPFFGGMPLCHGAGGLAGQYYFGARTGGTNIIEGLIEISMGLFLAASIAGLLKSFPLAIIGAMMLLVGLELVRFAKEVRLDAQLPVLAATVAVALLTNMAVGFLAGIGVHYGLQYIKRAGNVAKAGAGV